MINTYVISDLHLVDGGPRDPFAWGDRLPHFNSFLDFVEEHSGHLIIAGDLLDLWRGNFSKAMMHYAKLLDRLAAMGAVYVLGNHDCDLRYFIGTDHLTHPIFKKMSLPFILNDCGKRIKIMHGHEADAYCANDMPGMGHILAIITAQMEEKNGGPVWHGKGIEELFVGGLEKMVTFHERFWGKKPRDLELMQGLKVAVDNDECDMVVAGHTHTPGQIGNWYYNSGSWCTVKPNSFIWITGGEVRIFDWLDYPIANTVVLGE
jgi:UDP-2,3-diacylglucosamine pyrophosphatase LpxH